MISHKRNSYSVKYKKFIMPRQRYIFITRRKIFKLQRKKIEKKEERKKKKKKYLDENFQHGHLIFQYDLHVHIIHNLRSRLIFAPTATKILLSYVERYVYSLWSSRLPTRIKDRLPVEMESFPRYSNKLKRIILKKGYRGHDDWTPNASRRLIRKTDSTLLARVIDFEKWNLS